ncbi:TadE/TadG family type IV pilus assembly protein [Agrobacterium sp. 22-221-1]
MTSRRIKKAAWKWSLFSSLLRDRAGTFAIMTALLLPVFIILLGLLFEGGRALAYYNQSKRVMAMACERATKPTRTFTLSDEVRRANVAGAFDAMIQSTKQKVLSRDVQVKWTETKINAEFSYGLIFSEMFNLEKLKYRLDESCEGIPPYPEDDAVIIDNMFESNALGVERVLKNGVTKETPGGCWGVYPYSEIGWDGGTGPGVELQDWSSPCCRRNHNWEGYPAGMQSKKLNEAPTANDKACTLKEVDKAKTTDKIEIDKKAGAELSLPTRYVMELDSDWGPPKPGKKKNIEANSSIYKNVELHPGIYKIMVWYNGRRAAEDVEKTNGIKISLQQLLPDLQPQQRVWELTQDKKSIAWTPREYILRVKAYSIYRVTIEATGLSDSFGGIITGFQLIYVDRMEEG